MQADIGWGINIKKNQNYIRVHKWIKYRSTRIIKNA